MVVVARDSLLPSAAPCWRAVRRGVEADRRATGYLDLDIAATNKAERAVVEIIGVEIIHGDRDGAGPHEGIDAGIFIEEEIDRGGRLMRKIAADRARPGFRII